MLVRRIEREGVPFLFGARDLAVQRMVCPIYALSLGFAEGCAHWAPVDAALRRVGQLLCGEPSVGELDRPGLLATICEAGSHGEHLAAQAAQIESP